ncbi:hypothetical protein L1987_89747 [Smallanthus sonchifolius]|nr:hypothetical protein L1987_89747 [Smallanthus sonchifolius]
MNEGLLNEKRNPPLERKKDSILYLTIPASPADVTAEWIDDSSTGNRPIQSGLEASRGNWGKSPSVELILILELIGILEFDQGIGTLLVSLEKGSEVEREAGALAALSKESKGQEIGSIPGGIGIDEESRSIGVDESRSKGD